jgi:hypothetical protein
MQTASFVEFLSIFELKFVLQILTLMLQQNWMKFGDKYFCQLRFSWISSSDIIFIKV